MHSEQKQRLENAVDNIEAARLLAHQRYFDIAVTRAYYAMFYAAEALLLKYGLTFRQHDPVIDHFQQLFADAEPLFQPYQNYLREAYAARLEADYRPLNRAKADDALRQIRRAENFVCVAEGYLNPHLSAAEGSSAPRPLAPPLVASERPRFNDVGFNGAGFSNVA
ncbi:MAG: HEPN domain-containing protein [Cyanobacteria bacterium P01_A01_bin.105]